MKTRIFYLAVALMLLMGGCRPSEIAIQPKALIDSPRILVMSAFGPETEALLKRAEEKTPFNAANHHFTTARLGGKKVVIVESGVSMVNAAITTQTAVDHFNITAIIFSGIAGGVNPELNIGDVVIPAEWGQHMESVLARQQGKDWEPGLFKADYGNFGMIFPQPVTVPRPGSEGGAYDSVFWFKADPDMLRTAETISAGVRLEKCWLVVNCLPHEPRIVTGGRGLSGPAFVDNADYRTWLYANFQADAVDMETAAVAQAAYVNQVPFLGFRSLSDLAGGSAGKNELLVFGNLAAENAARVVEEFLLVWKGP